MERIDIINVFNGMCERCLIKGIIQTLDEAKSLCEVFDRFNKNNYKNDTEYSDDISYLYNLAVKLHESGNTSLGESYSIYGALLAADNVDFIEFNNVDNTEKNVDNVDNTEKIVKVEPIKLKKSKKS